MLEIIHYQDPQSRAMRSQAILDAFEIPHQKVFVDIRKGEHKAAEYKAIHPSQRVPALKHGETVIIESGAITLYLADLFAEKMKTPSIGTPARGRLYEWLFFLQTTLESHAIQAFDPTRKEEAKVKIRELLSDMAVKFVGPFVLGEDFSVADVILHTELAWYKMMDLYPEGLEPYDGFMQRYSQR